MSSPEERVWLAEHLFVDGGIYTPATDRVVLDVVAPFVRRCRQEGWIDGWFFIRYSEHGPHVRLRLRGRPEVLEREAAPALHAHLAALHPGVAEGLPSFPEGTWPADPAGADAEPRVTHRARIAYEPETERYGGPDGVRLAERFFEVSSDAAVALLERTSRTERSSRLGKGLLSMVVLAHVFLGEREKAAAFMHRYGIGYLHAVAREEGVRDQWLDAFGQGYRQQSDTLATYVEEVWSRMDEDDELSEVLDAYRDALREVRGEFEALLRAGRLFGRDGTVLGGWEEAVGAIVSSYVHMMNNRLGITIQEESYLAYLVHLALTTGAESPAPA